MISNKEIEFIKLVLQGSNNIVCVPSIYWSSLDKQHYYYLEKWESKGYWDSGVSSRSGWPTMKGLEYFKKVLSNDEQSNK